MQVRDKNNDHYRSGMQAWDFIALNNMNFMAGNIIKYIMRYPKKGTPVQDLEKALDYTQKYIETMGEWLTTPCSQRVKPSEFLELNPDTSRSVAHIVTLIYRANISNKEEYLLEAQNLIQELLREYQTNR